MDDRRPDPDELLNRISRNKEGSTRGRLKIFFGYAAGVGKTYSMLENAHDELESGVDVVIGYIEPHTRPETMALLEGFEILPVKKIPYKGIALNEFDLDAAIKRSPSLIIVDELAHTNAPGCRHSKRYGDIEELLDAGIDVYTTVNVQHIESLNDIVASITGVIVKERIPDRIFNMANHVELIDIEPETLLKRLGEGKIYKEKQAQSALNNFFSKGNLVALREIALRKTADRVNMAASGERSIRGHKYYTNEHILVCLSSAPSNARVIRTAARIAEAFHATFTALFVETPKSRELRDENIGRLRENLKLAEELGATVSTTYGDDVAYQIAEFSVASGVSKIIIGRAGRGKGLFHSSLSFADKLVGYAPNIDIYVIPDKDTAPYKERRSLKGKLKISLRDCIRTTLVMFVCIIIGFIFYSMGVKDTNIITIFILGVLVTSLITDGKLYGISASILGVLLFNFLFTYPSFSFDSYGADYPVTFLVMLTSAIVTSTLTSRVKSQGEAAALNAFRMNILLQAGKELQDAISMEQIAIISLKHIYRLVRKPVVFYTIENDIISDAYTCKDNEGTPLDPIYTSEDERAVAYWVIRNRRRAGASTDTLPGAKSLYIPLVSGNKSLAAVGIVLENSGGIGVEEKSLLMALLNQITASIDRYD